MAPDFADGAWLTGGGLLGAETNASLTPLIQTNFATNYDPNLLTYYFRRTFTWNGALTGNSFVLDQYVDDGVVYYLNGRELRGPNGGRVRMNAGEVTHESAANALPTGGDAFEELGILTGTLDGQLVAGTNVLCAEVHQSGIGSSDMIFGARFKILSQPPGGVMINEVKPGVAGGGFVEFFNPGTVPVDLNGWYLSDSAANLTKFRIGASMVVPPSGLVLTSPIVVILTQPDGITRQSMISSGMGVDGRSVGRKPSGSGNWFLFTQPTPGASNESLLAGGRSPLRLSEAGFGAAGGVEWVELYNAGSGVIDLTGLSVAGRSDLGGKVGLSGTIAAGGYASVNVNFPTDANGDVTLYVADGGNNVISAAAIERRPGLSSMGSWPAGSEEWYAAAVGTRNAANNPVRNTDIVINEIMFDPPSGHVKGEYVELTNKGGATVDLSGWRFSKGIDFDFPAGVTLAPGA